MPNLYESLNSQCGRRLTTSSSRLAVCVTYETNDMRAGEVGSFASGYGRRGDKQIFMDPCLASRE